MRNVFKCVAVLFGAAAIALILHKTIKCSLYDGAGVEFCAFDTAIVVVETVGKVSFYLNLVPLLTHF